VNGLLKLSLGLLAILVAGCGHEALVTGPTQCFAPHRLRAAAASDIVQGRTELTAQATPGTGEP